MRITRAQAQRIGTKIGVNFQEIPLEQFLKGLLVEQEHRDVTMGDVETTAKIAFAHLREFPNYYAMLEKMELRGKKHRHLRMLEAILGKPMKANPNRGNQ